MKEEAKLAASFSLLSKTKVKEEGDTKTANPSFDIDGKLAPLTIFLRERFQALKQNKIYTILFIYLLTDKGKEISGHIDLNQR